MSLITRTGSFSQYTRLSNEVSQVQKDLARLQIQVSTGEKADTFQDIAADTNKLLITENALTNTKRHIKSIDAVALRTNVTDQTMESLLNLVAEFKSLMVSTTNAANFNVFDAAGRAKDMMDRAAGFLNTKIDGKYIFSGSATTTAPVVLDNPLGVPADQVPGTPAVFDTYDFTDAVTDPTEYGYYHDFFKGNDDALYVRVDETQTVQYNVTANEEGFKEMFYALRLASTIDDASVTTDAQKKARLDKALEMITSAEDKIIDRYSQFGQRLKLMDNAMENHKETEEKLSEVVNNIEAVDIPTAMTHLSQFQTQLQASYLTLARLQSITLLDYMRT